MWFRWPAAAAEALGLGETEIERQSAASIGRMLSDFHFPLFFYSNHIGSIHGPGRVDRRADGFGFFSLLLALYSDFSVDLIGQGMNPGANKMRSDEMNGRHPLSHKTA